MIFLIYINVFNGMIVCNKTSVNVNECRKDSLNVLNGWARNVARIGVKCLAVCQKRGCIKMKKSYHFALSS